MLFRLLILTMTQKTNYAQISDKGYDFCYVECILQVMMVVRIFQFLPQSQFPNIEKQQKSYWISIRVSSETKPFDTNLDRIMPNLANGRVILNFSNSILVQKSSSLLYSNFIVDLYIVYELNNWPRNSTNYSPLKKIFLYNQDSLHARLNSHYKIWSYKNMNHIKIKA